MQGDSISTSANAAQHTPGPWRARLDGQSSYVEEETLGIAGIVPFVHGGDDREAEANARLIAAAPAMLAALEALDLECRFDLLNPCTLSGVPGKHWAGSDACTACTARAAVALARGEAVSK